MSKVLDEALTKFMLDSATMAILRREVSAGN